MLLPKVLICFGIDASLREMHAIKTCALCLLGWEAFVGINILEVVFS